jgi:MoxR-like ATPase
LNEILTRTTGKANPEPETAASGQQIIAMQNLARQVPIASHINEYISRLIVATHPGSSPSPLVNQYVRYGSSPRGGQALVLGAKITALLAGRYNVSFDDVTAVAPAALRHRLLLNFEGQAEGIKPDDVVADLIEQVASSK